MSWAVASMVWKKCFYKDPLNRFVKDACSCKAVKKYCFFCFSLKFLHSLPSGVVWSFLTEKILTFFVFVDVVFFLLCNGTKLGQSFQHLLCEHAMLFLLCEKIITN